MEMTFASVHAAYSTRRVGGISWPIEQQLQKFSAAGARLTASEGIIAD